MTTHRLDKLKAQRATLEARIQLAEARAKTQQRKQDTRRKILVGSYYLDQAQKNHQLDELKNIMDGYLTRNSDRKLFDLPERTDLELKPE